MQRFSLHKCGRTQFLRLCHNLLCVLVAGFSFAQSPQHVEAWEVDGFGAPYVGMYVKVTDAAISWSMNPYNPMEGASVYYMPWMRTSTGQFDSAEAAKWAELYLWNSCKEDMTGCDTGPLVMIPRTETLAVLRDAYKAARDTRRSMPAELTGYVIHIPLLGRYELVANSIRFPTLGLSWEVPIEEFLVRRVSNGTLAKYLRP